MKTQVILPLLGFLGMLLVADRVQAGECSILRNYKDAARVLQHFSTEQLSGQASQSESLCRQACARQAMTITREQALNVQNPDSIAWIETRCLYHDGLRRTSSTEIIDSSLYPVSQLVILPDTNPSDRTRRR